VGHGLTIWWIVSGVWWLGRAGLGCDVVDGAIARRMGSVTEFGGLYDWTVDVLERMTRGKGRICKLSMYECWNPQCPAYAGNGVRLQAHEVFPDNAGHIRCAACASVVRAVPLVRDDPAKGVAGAAGGALIGWAVGGPAGAVVGGILGLLVGAASGSKGS
jgi:CDP-alcohol phosphatidyltransferase